MSGDVHATNADSMHELIEQLDEDRVVQMVEAESRNASPANSNRIEKRLLDDLGLFDIDVNEYDLSDDLVNKIELLRYVDVDSDEDREASDETKRRVNERLRELGVEPDRDE